MQNIFLPHPFSTPVGILTERATDSGQCHEDWSLILEICDAINERDEGPKEAIRAIRKRLSSSAGKDNVSIWYTLLLLETCIKNCGSRFRSQVATKEFLQCYLKLLSPKNNPPQSLQTKILHMLKFWVLSNWDVPGRRDLEKIYATLLQKGVQFPNNPPEGDLYGIGSNGVDVSLEKQYRGTLRPSNPHVETPPHPNMNGKGGDNGHQISVNGDRTFPHHACQMYHTHEIRPHIFAKDLAYRPTSCHAHSNTCHSTNPHTRSIRPDQLGQINHRTVGYVDRSAIANMMIHRNNFVPQDYAFVNGNGQQTNHISKGDHIELDDEGTIRHLNTAQKIKLNEDLAIVETNVNLLNDLLAELRPDTVSNDDLNLLHELSATCRAMHQRVMIFLSQVSDEEVTPALIQVNDNLNNALSRYQRFEHYYERALRGSDPNLNLSRLTSNSNPTSQRAIDAGESRLAITSGPSCHPSHRNGQETKQRNNQSHAHGDDSDNNTDDDDSLLDLSDIPAITGPSEQSDETDEIAQWLANRQLIAVSKANVPSSSTSSIVQTSRATSNNSLALIQAHKQDNRPNAQSHRAIANGQPAVPRPNQSDIGRSSLSQDMPRRHAPEPATQDLVKF